MRETIRLLMSTRSQRIRRGPAILRACLLCALGLVLGSAFAGCSFSHTSGPTNDNPLSYLRNDIIAAGITPLEGSEDGEEGLYLTVIAPEGQDASAVADELVSLTRKYQKELDVRWLHVIIKSTGGGYRHTFDLNSSPSSI